MWGSEKAMPRAFITDDDLQTLESLSAWIKSQGFEVAPACLPGAADTRALEVRLPDSDYPTPVPAPHLKKLVSGLHAVAPILSEDPDSMSHLGPMIGVSASMREVFDQIQRVAPTEATVLVTGETGTGKELVVQSIHNLSHRASGPFVPVNCGATAASLIESELFGHERGSFTGATQRHRGFFEQASGGTLFLDEITEMPLELQVKLLRALEGKKIRRIGGDCRIDVDVRLIAATNANPRQAVREGKLREDLLYRLLVFPIHLPPLRERPGDIELIADAVINRLRYESGFDKRLSEPALEGLRGYTWPGNVRELTHALERAFIMADETIEPPDLELDGPLDQSEDDSIEVGTTVAESERRLILKTLEHYGGDKPRTAQTLGISLKTLYNRLHAYGAFEGPST